MPLWASCDARIVCSPHRNIFIFYIYLFTPDMRPFGWVMQDFGNGTFESFTPAFWRHLQQPAPGKGDSFLHSNASLSYSTAPSLSAVFAFFQPWNPWMQKKGGGWVFVLQTLISSQWRVKFSFVPFGDVRSFLGCHSNGRCSAVLRGSPTL